MTSLRSVGVKDSVFIMFVTCYNSLLHFVIFLTFALLFFTVFCFLHGLSFSFFRFPVQFYFYHALFMYFVFCFFIFSCIHSILSSFSTSRYNVTFIVFSVVSFLFCFLFLHALAPTSLHSPSTLSVPFFSDPLYRITILFDTVFSKLYYTFSFTNHLYNIVSLQFTVLFPLLF